MAGYYGKDIIPEIQSRLDIVEVVSQTVDLTRKGNRYWGKCPFHNENTASFCVTPEKNMFYCFGCNTGGDIFTFIMKRDNLDFAEALDFLAKKAGIERVSRLSPDVVRQREKLLAINKAVADYYQQSLAKSSLAKNYAANRNINEASISRFKIGYADDKWDSLETYLLKKGFTSRDILEAGLIKYSEKANKNYDIFRNRIIFPIFATNGDILGFGGRVFDDSLPKYINSPETKIYSKRHNLYGLFQAKEAIRSSNYIILVEGYFDCIKLHQYGINNVVASLGTAFTLEQAELIKRYAEEVVILYDADEAGQRETLKVIDILSKEDIRISVATLPNAIDPDDYIDLYGKEDFLYFLKNNKVSYIEFKLNNYLSTMDNLLLEDKVKIINNLRPDLILLQSELEKDYFVKLLSYRLQVEENIIYRELRQNSKITIPQGIKRHKKQIIRDNRLYANYTTEEKLVASMIKSSDILVKISSTEAISAFPDSDLKELAYVIMDNHFNNKDLEAEIRTRGLESTWARVLLCLEEANLKLYEINDYVKQVAINKRQMEWQNMHQILASLSEDGDFKGMLEFILLINNKINSTQEGGI